MLNVAKEVAALQRMTVRELRIRYADIYILSDFRAFGRMNVYDGYNHYPPRMVPHQNANLPNR